MAEAEAEAGGLGSHVYRCPLCEAVSHPLLCRATFNLRFSESEWEGGKHHIMITTITAADWSENKAGPGSVHRGCVWGCRCTDP